VGISRSPAGDPAAEALKAYVVSKEQLEDGPDGTVGCQRPRDARCGNGRCGPGWSCLRTSAKHTLFQQFSYTTQLIIPQLASWTVNTLGCSWGSVHSQGAVFGLCRRLRQVSIVKHFHTQLPCYGVVLVTAWHPTAFSSQLPRAQPVSLPFD
jgi:hypothetical protein